jgi:hypothetical protein
VTTVPALISRCDLDDLPANIRSGSWLLFVRPLVPRMGFRNTESG